MSVEQLLAPRSFAFGSLQDGLWGACWLSLPTDDGRHWLPAGDACELALGAGPDQATVAVSVSDGGPTEPWLVTGEGTELAITPTSPAPPEAPTGAAEPGLDQVCQIDGTLTVGGASRSVTCLGWRGSGGPLEAAGQLESFRQLAAWFAPGEGLALLAVRPRSAKGQDQDVITATTLDPEHPAVVAEPRLSTTYDAGGRPVRAGLELWLDEDEEDQQRSRRAAGEAAAGRPAIWNAGPLSLQAQLFRWHSAGRDGAGFYLTGRLR